MPTFIKILARSAEVPSAKELREFVHNGFYFDEGFPKFENLARPDDGYSVALRVDHAAERRPIDIMVLVNKRDVADWIREIIENDKPKPPIAKLVRGTHCVVVIEFSAESMTDASWTMLDNLESYLCKKYEGIVFARGQGFFDADLDPL